MEVRQALLTWFVDVRESLKGRLSHAMLKLRANELYDEWCVKTQLLSTKD